ncbi:sensor histidine kinase [Planobispora longispora]|uniref:sensor histidine kinase n=1 Tax=Planobispora longispora TaxID=28887 RepID=UPI00360E1D11
MADRRRRPRHRDLRRPARERLRRLQQGARQRGYPGTGLGLAICRRIVNHHGGEIRVEENPGGGSRFIFTLPVTPEPSGQDPAAGRDGLAAATGRHPG